MRRMGHVLVVLALICVGIVSSVLGSLANCGNYDPPCSGATTDSLMIRAFLAWLTLVLFFVYRSHPRVVLGGGAFIALVLGLDPFMLSVGLTVVLARATTRTDRAFVVGGYLALVAAFALQFWHLFTSWPEGEGQTVGQWLLITAMVLTFSLVTAIALTVRARRGAREASAMADQEAERNVEMADELFRQQERENLAREVHDTLASRLTSISLQSGTLEDQLGDEEAQDAARNVRHNASQALTDLRALLASLREGGAPSGAPAKNLHTGLADLLDLIEDAGASGLVIHPVIALDGYASAPETLRRATFRITQEALTNALRHSSDHTVHMRIEGVAGSGLRLMFRNGAEQPSTYTQGAGEGLRSLRERVALLGGSFERSHIDGVHTLQITLPWLLP